MALQALTFAAPADNLPTAADKVNDNFNEVYTFLGGSTLTAPAAGRVVLGNAGSGFTSDSNLTWDATNGLTVLKPISCPVQATDERFGSGASIGATGGKNVAIGNGAVIGTQGGGAENTVIGASSSISSFTSFNTVLGSDNVYTGGGSSIVIGNGVSNSSANSVAIGTSLTISGTNAGAIGRGITNASTGGMALGKTNPAAGTPNYTLIQGWADSVAGTGIGFHQWGATTAFVGRFMWGLDCDWITSTDASRKARAKFYIYDTATREFMQAEASGTAAKLAFFGSTAVVQPATTGTTTGFTTGTGTAVFYDSTFTGNTGTAAYTIGDIVLALKQLGLLAA